MINKSLGSKFCSNILQKHKYFHVEYEDYEAQEGEEDDEEENEDEVLDICESAFQGSFQCNANIPLDFDSFEVRENTDFTDELILHILD